MIGYSKAVQIFKSKDRYMGMEEGKSLCREAFYNII